MSRGSAGSSVDGKKGGKASPLRMSKGEEASVYDSLLFVSLGFLLMGIVFLILELSRYGFRIVS